MSLWTGRQIAQSSKEIVGQMCPTQAVNLLANLIALVPTTTIIGS